MDPIRTKVSGCYIEEVAAHQGWPLRGIPLYIIILSPDVGGSLSEIQQHFNFDCIYNFSQESFSVTTSGSHRSLNGPVQSSMSSTMKPILF